MLKHLEALCNIYGVSGDEVSVCDYIIEQIENNDTIKQYSIDPLGNLIVEKIGLNRSPKKLMVGAHMDEVGLIITYINEDGTLKFAPVGGIEPSVVLGRTVVVGSKHIPGVIGSKPIHLLSGKEKDTIPDFSSMYLDIGAKSREDAIEYVSLGDYVYFNAGFVRLGNGKIRSKALDDRIGCAIMLELIEMELPYDVTFTFHVQEEIGLRGAKTAAYTVNPDIAIILEATTASDIADISDENAVCHLGGGAVVSFMDRSTIYDKDLYNLAYSISKEEGIPCQTKTKIAGGNDSGAVHISRGGVKTIAISAPCRYIHSPSSVVEEKDLDSCLSLTRLLMEKAVLIK
ncbi:MAG: M42 family metallopeptidase [Ruminococcus sp.]|nr:M42 family metallopeptidase [Ruminococcus sp.]